MYACANVDSLALNDELLGSMALLFENRLGLKSGRQDVDGLLPNDIKVLTYAETSHFLIPKGDLPNLAEDEMDWSNDFRDFIAICLTKDPKTETHCGGVAAAAVAAAQMDQKPRPNQSITDMGDNSRGR